MLPLLALVLASGPAAPAASKVFYTQTEAVQLAFPDAERVETDTRLLSEQQVAAIEHMARSKLDSRIVKFYVGWRGGERLGYAYIDVHTVRTLPEAFMVVLDPTGRVHSLRVLAFHEPLDYMPTERWVEQFEKKGSDDRLRLGGDVNGILGATLSARAVTASVRRVLAYYRVLIAPALAASDGPVQSGRSGQSARSAQSSQSGPAGPSVQPAPAR